jgi:2-polyprenyl-6-methoxyphenol hydroxylase-like FAD-dependent oxidoreductase
MTDYDLITVGGGLGGSSLAKVMAEAGARVLVLERETAFKDRVRGEGMEPWGVVEAQALGLYEMLLASCGHEAEQWNIYVGSMPVDSRDLRATSRGGAALDFYHPTMQETLLLAAERAGAKVRRGVRVNDVRPGAPASVSLWQNGSAETLRARLVVGADGRESAVRRRVGFESRHDPKRAVVCGVLVDTFQAPSEAVHWIVPPTFGEFAIAFPLRDRQCRVYFVYQHGYRERRLSGKGQLAEFVESCVEVGMPREWFKGARPAGPLAAFEGADTWVENPSRDGVALIGDAAAASDPSWGGGLSLTLRDVRVLRDELLAHEDWSEAASRYAERHDAYYASLHRTESWYQRIIFDVGPEADAVRARALPKLVAREVDIVGLGPESPSDEEARRNFFEE